MIYPMYPGGGGQCIKETHLSIDAKSWKLKSYIFRSFFSLSFILLKYIKSQIRWYTNKLFYLSFLNFLSQMTWNHWSTVKIYSWDRMHMCVRVRVYYFDILNVSKRGNSALRRHVSLLRQKFEIYKVIFFVCFLSFFPRIIWNH